MPTGRTITARALLGQFLADAGDAGTYEWLVADHPQGEADQDRRQGGEPRPLHLVPDGRGRNPAADVPGDFATYRGTAAAAAVGTGMRRQARARAHPRG